MNDTFMKEKPILPLLLSMAYPMIISMLVNSLYNITDSFFISKINEDAITALSLVFPIQNFINAAAIGFGVGINAVVSYHLGAGDITKAGSAAAHGMILSAVQGIVAAVISILIMPCFFKMFSANAAVTALGLKYSRIAFSFAPVIMTGLVFEKIFQAEGKMKVTMAALICGCAANIVLDPILIFGIGFIPESGIIGAAIATVTGQLLTLLVYLFVYICKPIQIKMNFNKFKFNKKTVLRLYCIGIPAILNLALPSVLVSFLNSLLAFYSQSYVVILGIYYKLQTFLYLPANGVVQGMRPLVGYNFGAGEIKRVKKIYTSALCINLIIMIMGTILCLCMSERLISIFTANPLTVLPGSKAFKIISAGFAVSAVSVTSSGALEGLGKGVPSFMISLLRYIVVIIPAAYLLCKILGPMSVWNSFWIAEIITAAAATLIFKKALNTNPHK